MTITTDATGQHVYIGPLYHVNRHRERAVRSVAYALLALASEMALLPDGADTTDVERRVVEAARRLVME